MINVSTKTGDHGQSGLANGQRLAKDDLIFEVLGTQDELNSWLGVVIAKFTQLPDHFATHRQYLLHIQDTLFYIGAELARSPKASFSAKELDELEKKSDQLQASMDENWTTQFLYPGGNETAAFLDVARTVCRRLERVVVKYGNDHPDLPVNPDIRKYLNRLSDYLFVLRCYVNSQEKYQEKKFDAVRK